MAILADYTAGTISVSAEGTAVTGVGTAWQTAGFREGDWLIANGWVNVVSAVNSNTSITLAQPWRGGALSGAAYRLRYMSDGSRASAQARQLIDLLGGSGNLEALAGLVGSPNMVPYFSGYGTMQLVSFAALGGQWMPKGLWDAGTTYSASDMVEHGGHIFLSNEGSNTNNEPVISPDPASDAHWTWVPMPPGPGEIFALAFGTNDRPYPGEVLPPHVFVDTIVFPEHFSGSHAYAGVAPTAEAVLTLKKNGTPVGTITFAASASTGTFATSGTVTFTPGDVLTITCPSPRDDTFSQIAGTLRASLV